MSNGTKNQLVVMREFFDARRIEVTHALPPDIKYEQILRAVTTSAMLNPTILACTKQSLYFAVLHACRDGLLPDGKEAALVPYKDKAGYIPMYQGLLRRFRRSGKFKSISAHVVREGEPFKYYIDENGPHLNHEPGDSFEAPIARVYARASTKDGGIFIDVMSKAEVDKHRAKSRAMRDDSPWNEWYEEMAKKTVIIRLSKYLPDARDIIGDELDEVDDDGSPAPVGIFGVKAVDGGAQVAAQPPEQGTSAAPEESASASAEPSPGSEPAAAGLPFGTEQSTAPDDDVGETAIAAAWNRGIKAKASSQRRSAIPREYTDGQHDQLAAAWLAGFDDRALPSKGAST